MSPVTRHKAKTAHENPTVAAAVKMMWPRPSKSASAVQNHFVLVNKWKAKMEVAEEELLSELEGLTPEDLVDDLGLGGKFGDRRAKARRMAAQAVWEGQELKGRAEVAMASSRPPTSEPEHAQKSQGKAEWFDEEYTLPPPAGENWVAVLASTLARYGITVAMTG
ncbi:hypothetical protein LTR36_003801 [Oleoguttula mirabilis]|uniref:Uncharacterized protein n=1 Tax=Oleoguttula mirabilis TaxID=1507867 RepID=A0AAV9JHL8_9PEZI|nr:hypothetical protein LTR36_003801 [Oleoguttula mirabilis]